MAQSRSRWTKEKTHPVTKVMAKMMAKATTKKTVKTMMTVTRKMTSR